MHFSIVILSVAKDLTYDAKIIQKRSVIHHANERSSLRLGWGQHCDRSLCASQFRRALNILSGVEKLRATWSHTRAG